MLNKVRMFSGGVKLPSLRLFILIFFLSVLSDGHGGAAAENHLKQQVLKDSFPVFRQCFGNSLEINQLPQVASDNDNIFIYSGGNVYSFQKINLKLNWIDNLGSDAASEFQIIGQKLFIVSKISQTKNTEQTDTNRKIITETIETNKTKNAESSNTTQILWTIDTASGLTVGRSELPDGEKYYLQNFHKELLAENSNGLLLFFDDRGAIRNTLETNLNITVTPLISGQNIYLVDQQRLLTINLGSYEKTDGNITKNISVKAENAFTFPEAINALLINKDGKIWAGSERGTIYSLENTNRKLTWKYRTGARIDELKLDGERLLAISSDEFLYSFAAAKGSLKWKKRLENQIAGQMHLLGGRAVLQITDQNTVKSLDLKTGALINNDDFQTAQTANSAKPNNLYDVVETDRQGELILVKSDGLFYFSAKICPGQNSKS